MSMSEQLLEDEEDKAPDLRKSTCRRSLQSLGKQGIAALKAMKSIPPAVASTMEALRVLLQLPKGENPSRTDFLARIVNFDLFSIRPAAMKALETYVNKCDVASTTKASRESGREGGNRSAAAGSESREETRV